MHTEDPICWNAPADPHPARAASLASISAVTAREKTRWLALFAPDATVQDPVGPSMLDPDGGGHRGIEAISRFWDATVAQIVNTRVTVADSFAGGDSCANIATIVSELPGGNVLTIDAVLAYTVDERGLITSLRAHWEPERAAATLTAIS